MEILKIGMKGEEVRLLQEKLGLKTIDGVFGKITEAKVKEYQKSKGLVADGIVGKATWQALGVNGDMKCIDPSVIYSPLSVHVTKSIGRPITYLVIHYTAGRTSIGGTARRAKQTFETNSASADFVVDDGEIVQYNPDIRNYYCWAVGGNNYHNHGGTLYGKATNKNCISIEICSMCSPNTRTALSTVNHNGWSFTEETLENAKRLARMIMKKYNIDKSHVIRHYDVTGKMCPALIGWNDEPVYNIEGKKIAQDNNSQDWQKFKESL